MLADALAIFLTVLLPVFVVVGFGAAIEKWHALNVSTLISLNLYVFVPAYLFSRVSGSTLAWGEILRLGLVVLIPMAAIGLSLFLAMRRAGASGQTIAALTVGGLFFNAGNFGIPVAELAFGVEGGRVQALIVMFMNLSTFLFGYAILALSQGKGPRAMLGFFRLPMIYVTVAALLVRDLRITVPSFIDRAVEWVADGMIAMALVTLGAQLATHVRWPRWSLMGPVLVMKLAVTPLATAAVVWLLGLWPWPGAQLILAASAPTAVNTLLLTLELEGDAKTAADCIFWTTLGSSITVAIVLTVLQALGGGPS